MYRSGQFKPASASLAAVIMFVLLLSIPATLNAESLMVYIEAWDPERIEQLEDEEDQLDVAYFLSAVEAGVMDVFFDADYIVFNAGPITGVEEDGRRSDQHVLSVAHEGGADLLIRFSLRFEQDGNGMPKPTLGELSYFRVDGADEMLSEQIEISELLEEHAELTGELGFKIGTAVARRVLESS